MDTKKTYHCHKKKRREDSDKERRRGEEARGHVTQDRKQLVYEWILDPRYVPMKIKDIAVLLQVSDADRPELARILAELVDEGKILCTKRGKYKKWETVRLVGTFDATGRGFGFVRVEGRKDDVFIPPESVNGAMQGDTVRIALTPAGSGKRDEGVVTQVVERAVKEIVGTYRKSRNYGFVVPDDPRFARDIFVPKECAKEAQDGCKVVVRLTDYGDAQKNPSGEIARMLGQKDEPGVDILSLAYGFGLPMEFPGRVLRQAERVSNPVSAADMQGRLDLRDMAMVTIDGEDAKDLDDAVSLSYDAEAGIWKLGVHIADVANYVQENSALDAEAKLRGTSVYLPGQVIPMLPHALSNGICSLSAGEDRLALSCLMDIDQKGSVVGHQIAETVIRVDLRMTYAKVSQALKGQETDPEYAPFVPMLQDMDALAKRLRARRRARGSIDFDFPESKIVLDACGRAEQIAPYARNDATRLIEDFMLAANETVAQAYYWQELPFLYRTHDVPDPEKMLRLSLLIANFGYGMRGSRKMHPKELQKLLARVADSPEEGLISRLALRSMKRANYTVECTGHFGLAAKYYCHFTSPIRRYPDLQIHRIIKDNLRGRMDGAREAHYREILPEVAAVSSQRERRADEAEREACKMKKAEYMQSHVGEVFSGIISGMNAHGFFVELSNTVEGMVHVRSLTDGHYDFDEDACEMRRSDGMRAYGLGQAVQVRVIGANKDACTVDFCVCDEEWDTVRGASAKNAQAPSR